MFTLLRPFTLADVRVLDEAFDRDGRVRGIVADVGPFTVAAETLGAALALGEAWRVSAITPPEELQLAA